MKHKDPAKQKALEDIERRRKQLEDEERRAMEDAEELDEDDAIARIMENMAISNKFAVEALAIAKFARGVAERVEDDCDTHFNDDTREFDKKGLQFLRDQVRRLWAIIFHNRDLGIIKEKPRENNYGGGGGGQQREMDGSVKHKSGSSGSQKKKQQRQQR